MLKPARRSDDIFRAVPVLAGFAVRILAKYFLRGLLITVPIAATAWILYKVFGFVDGLVSFPEEAWRVPLVGWRVPGVSLRFPGSGVLMTGALVTLVGLLGSNYFTRQLFTWSEGLFTRMPGVKQLYNAIKDLIQALVSEDKKFDKPVLLRLGEGIEVIGFVTRESLAEMGLGAKIAVYVPQSYNFAANLIIVPSERVTPIELPPADVMAFVVSGGVLSVGSAAASES